MPWVVGIDEAGYGPNLGPLVMTAVACRVPDGQDGADLWRLLDKAVRRHGEPDDGRLLVADSKLVHSASRGLLALEKNVLATLPPGSGGTLGEYVAAFCPDSCAELQSERWYDASLPLPVETDAVSLADAAVRFQERCSAAGLAWGRVYAVAYLPAAVNALIDHWGTKAAVLSQGMLHLLRVSLQRCDSAPVRFLIDQHGGRRHYCVPLQEGLPDCRVIVRDEGAGCSRYGLAGLGREVELVFQPRADVEHLCVALASMFSKYLREVFMLQFNRFWQTHVPGLAPTAGYPGDAGRFWAAIRPVCDRLGILERSVWRQK